MKSLRILLFLVCAGMSFAGVAQEAERKIATVNLTAETGLAEALGEDLLNIDSLVVSGTFSATDIPALRQAVGGGKLVGINMKDCSFEGNAIPPEMLYGTKNLRYFTFPENIEKIGAWAFAGCGALRELELPATVTELGHGAFCQALGATGVSKFVVTIPASVKVIPVRCFELASFTEINLPDGLEELGDSALMYVQFAKSLQLPNSLKRIGNYALSCMMSLESVDVPEGVELGDYVFWDDLNLATATLEGDRSAIPEGTFDTCRKLSQFQMPEGVETIGINAFCRTALSSVTLPEGLRNIGENAFYDTQLTTITIPASVQAVGKSAFAMSKKLKTAHFDGEIETLVATFNGCAKLETANLPGGLCEIGENTFMDCALLTGDLEIPSGVTAIGSSAFYRTGYTSVTLPKSVTEIGFSAFEGTPIASVNIKEGLTNIGEAAFKGCKLTTLDLPSTTEEIGFYAFSDCPLTKVTCKSVDVPSITGKSTGGYTDEYTPFTSAPTATLVVPRDTRELYQAALYWKRFGTIEESDFTDSVEDISVTLPTSGAVYDIQGRQVTEVQPGQVYIQDGKKVLVK